MEKIFHLIETFIEWTGRICSWTVAVLTGLVVFEVIMRYVFNRPTIWSFELCIMLYAFLFMIVAAYTLLYRAHVSVDFVWERLSPRGRAILDVISYAIFFFPFLIILFIEGYKFAADSWAMRERSWSVWGPPMYPYKTVIPVSAFLLILEGLCIFIRRLYVAIKGEQTNG
jgi:TRAP-type mannitol/chloroaromatic compound transport system permease small subunit